MYYDVTRHVYSATDTETCFIFLIIKMPEVRTRVLMGGTSEPRALTQWNADPLKVIVQTMASPNKCFLKTKTKILG